MHRHRFGLTRVLILATSLGLAACQLLDAEPLSPAAPDDLNSALARWAQAGPEHYSMVIQQQCFCPAEFTQPIRIEVKQGEIVALEGLNQPVTQIDRAKRQLKTVARLFDFVDWAQRNQPYLLRVNYNTQYGYPDYIRYDGHARIADDEFEYRVTEFVSLH